MTTYTVHHLALTAPEILKRSDETEFVKEGFCWPALFIPFIWLLYRRLWMVFFAYLAFVAGVSVLGELASFSEYLVTVLGTGANVVLAFEANNLRRWTLRQNRFQDVGVVIGKSLMKAERRYFQSLIDRGEPPESADPVPAGPAPRPVRIAGPLQEPAEMMGLFPSPGARA